MEGELVKNKMYGNFFKALKVPIFFIRGKQQLNIDILLYGLQYDLKSEKNRIGQKMGIL